MVTFLLLSKQKNSRLYSRFLLIYQAIQGILRGGWGSKPLSSVERGQTNHCWAIDLMGEITESTEFDAREQDAGQVISAGKKR
jgi:hypothetical protein